MATPYELLLGMSLLRDKQRQEAQQKQLSNNLEGAAFLRIRINKQEMLILQDEIKELMPALKVAAITPYNHWLFGFTSYKGELLPVIDLIELPELIEEDSVSDPSSQRTNMTNKHQASHRILVIQANEGLLGIQIDAVLGIQHYWLQSHKFSDTKNPWFQAWINIEDGNRQMETLPVLNIKKIVRYCHQQTH